MALLASEVLDRMAAVYLNDAAKTRWTDAVMLPVLKAAWDQLQLELTLVGAAIMREENSAPIVLTGLTRSLTLPLDLIYPINVFERSVGGADKDWVLMEQAVWEADAVQHETLDNWVWREDEIQFLGATVAREVKVQYKKFLNPISSAGSAVAVMFANNYLAPKAAALCAGFKGANPTRATFAEEIAERALDKIKGIYVQQNQSIPAGRILEYFQD